jgi:hypothetical protein
MPMHDWTKVKAGTYHNFHVLWMSTITNRLNAGLLPPDYFAMAEQIIGKPEADVVTLQTGQRPKRRPKGGNSVAVATEKPKARFVIPADEERYARKKNRVTVRHELGDVVAVIEVVSPGNKDRKHSLDTFIEKARDLILQRVNLLLIDPFPPGPHDPQGVHKALWDRFVDQRFELPADKPLTVAAYQAEPVKTAYVEPIAVGEPLPDMPLFLDGEAYIVLPLEETYRATWDVLPAQVRDLFEPGA